MTQQDSSKPESVREYESWLREQHNVVVDRRLRNHYDSVAMKMKSSFDQSPFWSRLSRNLRDYNEEYMTQNGYPLWMDLDSTLKIETKPFDSFLLKTFRRNVLDNDNWGNAPPGGWLLPDDWYSQVHDVVRMSMVVKYLDGVEFLCQKLGELCDSIGLGHKVSFEAREDGYYAAHFNVLWHVEIPKIDWDTMVIDAQVEIQVTTQLQEVIRKLLHMYYERRREGPTLAVGGATWQWEYQSDEFIANYLGHILHFVEGMIMEVRARTAEQAGTNTEVRR